jgi:hypothetical protein
MLALLTRTGIMKEMETAPVIPESEVWDVWVPNLEKKKIHTYLMQLKLGFKIKLKCKFANFDYCKKKIEVIIIIINPLSGVANMLTFYQSYFFM